MATEQVFQLKFVKPLLDCYGQLKLPQIRIQKIWERLKAYPDHVLGQCADRIILNFDNFPGVQTILNTCAEVGGEYARAEADKIKAELACFRCGSSGVALANNYAYRCNCQLGTLLYPSFPPYEGQVHIQEKVSVDESGGHIYENGNYLTTSPKDCRSIREVRTILKSTVFILPKKEAPRPALRKMTFDLDKDPA